VYTIKFEQPFTEQALIAFTIMPKFKIGDLVW